MDVDVDKDIPIIKEEPAACDESYEELPINLGEFLEFKQEEITDMISLVDPLECIQVKTEIKIEPELCLENASAICYSSQTNNWPVERKFTFFYLFIFINFGF